MNTSPFTKRNVILLILISVIGSLLFIYLSESANSVYVTTDENVSGFFRTDVLWGDMPFQREFK